MKQNWKQRFAALLLAFCLLAGCALPALATSANIDLKRTGTIEVTLYDHQNDTALRGGTLTLYKVANVTRTDGNLSFSYTKDFQGCGIALGDLTDSGLASKLEAKLPITAEGISRTIGEDGKVTFSSLPLGLYLVVQTENSKGYEAINSFLVSLPMKNGSGWLYEVDATPKVGAPTTEVPPEEPDNPSSEPEKPTEPDKPTEPGKPTEPETPDTPENPDNPDNPVSPGNPDNPVAPGTPDNPVAPGNPDNPVAPGSPDNPVLPGHPDTPVLPQSGQLNWPIPWMACSGLLLFAVGWVLNKKETAR